MERILERLAAGRLTRVAFLGPFASPGLVELFAQAGGYHGVWFDQEHAAIPHRELETLLLAARACGLDAFARVAPTDYTAIMRPMEAGASGVMVAQIRGVDEVRRVVGWARYPPRGIRGLFLGNHEARWGGRDTREHIEAANRDRFVAIQIETAEAVDRVEEIVSVDGVDLLFVGPGDLACSLGVPGDPLHRRCIDALERVAAAARTARKPWGVLARTPEHARTCRDLGCLLFSLSGDLDAIRRGITAAKETFGELFQA